MARYVEAGALRDLMRKMDPLGTALADSGLGRIGKLTRPYEELLREISGLADAIARTRGALASSLSGIELPRWALIDDRPGAEHVLRAQRWAEQINTGSLAQLAERYAARNRVGIEFESIARNAVALRGLEELRGSITPNLDKLIARNAAFEQTLLKMSALAGAIDTVGPLSPATDATFDSLLGKWRTRPDLPAEFWRRPSVRERYYRDADVDPWLVDADNAEVIEVFVESGVVEGEVEAPPYRRWSRRDAARH